MCDPFGPQWQQKLHLFWMTRAPCFEVTADFASYMHNDWMIQRVQHWHGKHDFTYDIKLCAYIWFHCACIKRWRLQFAIFRNDTCHTEPRNGSSLRGVVNFFRRYLHVERAQCEGPLSISHKLEEDADTWHSWNCGKRKTWHGKSNLLILPHVASFKFKVCRPLLCRAPLPHLDFPNVFEGACQ